MKKYETIWIFAAFHKCLQISRKVHDFAARVASVKSSIILWGPFVAGPQRKRMIEYVIRVVKNRTCSSSLCD